MTEVRSTLLAAAALALLVCPINAVAADGEQLGWALLLKPMCEKHVPGFAAQSKQAYANLRRNYPDAFAAYEANPPAPESPLQGNDLEQLQSQCASILDYLLNSGRPPDPRLATPEQTWKLFTGALRSADKEALAACFEPGARAKYLQTFQQLKPADLVALANSFTTFTLTAASSDEYQEALVKTSDGTGSLVLFVKSNAGWRISQL